MRITNQMLVNQLKKMAGKATATADGQSLKVGTAFTAKIANIYNGLLTLEIAPRVYVEARDTTGAQYLEGDVVEFVVTEHDSEGKVFIKAMSPEVMEMLDQKELQQVLTGTGLPATKDNMDIVKQLMLNKMPVTEANVRLISDAKIHFEKVIDLAQNNDLPLTEEKLQQAVKEVLIQQYKQGQGMDAKAENMQQVEQSKIPETSESTKSANQIPFKLETVDLKKTEIVNLKNEKGVMADSSKESMASNMAVKELPAEEVIHQKNDYSTPKGQMTVPTDEQKNDENMLKETLIKQETPLPHEALKELASLVKSLTPEKLVFLLKNQMTFSMNNVLQIEKMIIGKDQLTEQVQKLVDLVEGQKGSYEVAKTLDAALKGLEVIDFHDKDKVENQLKFLSQSLEKAVEAGTLKEGSAALRNQMTEVRQSIDFLNQLNDQMTYLQIPVMLNNQPNQVEIYVQRDHSGKKKINPRDTKIFISLDTNYLDLVQVLIEVKDQTLNLNFRLGDEMVENLIRVHEETLVNQMKDLGFEKVQFQYAIRDEKMDLTNMVRLESIDRVSKIDVRV